MTARRILFATIAAGGGHVTTAEAMAEALERHFPGRFETRVSDYMAELVLAGQAELGHVDVARPRQGGRRASRARAL